MLKQLEENSSDGDEDDKSKYDGRGNRFKRLNEVGVVEVLVLSSIFLVVIDDVCDLKNF